jgi:hypothetical protein
MISGAAFGNKNFAHGIRVRCISTKAVDRFGRERDEFARLQLRSGASNIEIGNGMRHRQSMAQPRININ